MKYFVPALAAAFLQLLLSPLHAETKPNIVFIIADDLGWADVEFHGGNTPTPNLNRLLAEGIELKRHYVAPVCSPTRAGFLTGRYWSRYGITTPINNRGLSFDTMTAARALGEAGYSTALIGKWHLGSKPDWGPNHFGFDHSYGSLAGGVAPYNHHYKKGEYSTTWHRNEKLFSEEGHVTDLLTDEATGWIRKQTAAKDREPFFLYVPFTAVHLPIREPEEWMAKVPEEIKGEVARQYSACILHLDDAVGKIVGAIDEAGLAKDTLIIFTSDNGGSTAQNNDTKYPDDQCPNGKLTGNNLPFRGQKGNLYEGGIRVPTIVRWPGTLKAGTTLDTPVCVIDWMPTFCALADAQVDGANLKWDGVNIWPALKEGSELPERSIYIAGPRGRQAALQDGDWKLIVSRANDKAANSKAELFNLANDSAEKHDISKDNPAIVETLSKKLEAIQQADEAPTGGL